MPEKEEQEPGLRKRFEERCRVAGLDFDAPYAHENEFPPAEVQMPAGEATRTVFLGDEDDVSAFLNVPFERFTWLGSYLAIASFEDDLIYARVETLATSSSSTGRFALFGRRSGRSGPRELSVASADGKSIELGPVPKELEALTPRHYVYPRAPDIGLVLRGFEITSHEAAVHLLEQVADSVFMQVEFERDVALALARTPPRYRAPRMPFPHDPMPLRFPTLRYDREAMALYWYARDAALMPLLQYLAFYQVIEYYLPTYCDVATRERVKSVLKSPDFCLNRDADLGRVLTAARPLEQRSGREKDQLRETIRHCVNKNDLRGHLTRSKESTAFFLKRNEAIADEALPINDLQTDLGDRVADRIYGLRCRIVHTKSRPDEESVRFLLPYSSAAEELGYDIELSSSEEIPWVHPMFCR